MHEMIKNTELQKLTTESVYRLSILIDQKWPGISA